MNRRCFFSALVGGAAAAVAKPAANIATGAAPIGTARPANVAKPRETDLEIQSDRPLAQVGGNNNGIGFYGATPVSRTAETTDVLGKMIDELRAAGYLA